MSIETVEFSQLFVLAFDVLLLLIRIEIAPTAEHVTTISHSTAFIDWASLAFAAFAPLGGWKLSFPFLLSFANYIGLLSTQVSLKRDVTDAAKCDVQVVFFIIIWRVWAEIPQFNVALFDFSASSILIKSLSNCLLSFREEWSWLSRTCCWRIVHKDAILLPEFLQGCDCVQVAPGNLFYSFILHCQLALEFLNLRICCCWFP